MIQTKVNFSGEDKKKMTQVLQALGSEGEAKMIVKCYKETLELYLAALVHLSKAYVLYQPTSVKYFKENKITNFWAVAADSLYDFGIMYLCGLLDKRSDINHKNLRKLIRNMDLLKIKPKNVPILDPKCEVIYEKLKTYRDTKLAHYEYSKETPINWEDPIILMNSVHKYIVDFEAAFLDTDFDLETLKERTENECYQTCESIGISHLAEDGSKEITHFFTKVENKWS